jgi:basic amino acid/polyamine antiporter, APA family
VLISFLIAGVASAAAALSYAEFAGLIPKAGSAYTYGYAVLGEIGGWFIGWDLLLEYTAIVSVVAIGISGYFSFLVQELGAELPSWMLGAPGTGDGHRVDLFAALLCLLIAYLLGRGIKNAARFETVVVVLKVLVVLLVIGVGLFHVDTGNYHPFFPYGLSGAFTGAATVFFAVFGYDAMSTAAEESRDSQRHMPKAIIYSLVISMVLYVLACLVLTGMQKYDRIDKESGFSTAFKAVGLGGVADIIAVGAIIGILTVMFTFMLGVTRVWFAMSRDGLLPRWFAKTHPTRHVPTRVTWIVGVASAVIAGFLPIEEAAELTNIGILLAFVVVCVAVIVLRYRRPDLPRTFRAPGMPVVPALGVVFSLWLTTFLAWQTWLRFGLWFVIGLLVYFGYSYRHSALAKDRTSPAEGGSGPPPGKS